MSKRKNRMAAMRLVNAFNAHEARQVIRAISMDCLFIDSAGDAIEGADALCQAVAAFMEIETDFAIKITDSTVVNDEVLLVGETRAHNPLVAKDRMWRAKIRDGKVCEWQSFCEGTPARLAMALGPVRQSDALLVS